MQIHGETKRLPFPARTRAVPLHHYPSEVHAPERYRLSLTHRSTIVLVEAESCVYSPSWLTIAA
jgi:hypothetical protein